MAHSPERPATFLCENCRGIYAGVITNPGENSPKYRAPAECSACGGTDFDRVETGIDLDITGFLLG